MSTSPIEAVGPAALTLTQRQRSYDHRFFTGMALVIALTAFVGFAPSYYLRGFSAAAPLTTLVHLHGALATSWILLLPAPLGFLAVPLGTLLSFAILAAVGLSQRRHRDTHKRLMLLATIAIITPAFARFRWFGPGGPPVAIGGTCLLVVACLVYDRSTRGRVHPAFLWGGVLLMLSLPARFALTQSEAWIAVARWLTR